jgi:arsenite-transporting ATPase
MGIADPAVPLFRDALDSLSNRRVLLFGGKGGVGKTTIASAAALHFARSRPVILFTTDPASNLGDLFRFARPSEDSSPIDERSPDGAAITNLIIEQLDAASLWTRFLHQNLEQFVELGDRGTWLDRDEVRRFFELSLPGVDELMAWMRIGELEEANPDSLIVVDTAPTGHTLRMLGADGHFRLFAVALDAMQAKHRDMVRQFTRRDVHDSLDAFIEDFTAIAQRRHELFTDPARCAFVPIALSEPWVLEQTSRLTTEVSEEGVAVPFVVLNRAVRDLRDDDCARDHALAARDRESMERLKPLQVVVAPRSCSPLDSPPRLEQWLEGTDASELPSESAPLRTASSEPLHITARVIFFAGKGGVGKTTCAASLALQLATAHPERRFTIISVDPAHTLPRVFEHEPPPPNLSVETIDTRAKWLHFRETLGREIDRTIDAFTPQGISVAYDGDAVKKLVEVAPPGADELFAINRLSDLMTDDSQSAIVVDTAPTGHFLRLLDLPVTAGEWVREFIRILLRYRELVAPGSLGEELVRASRALKELDAELHSAKSTVVVVTRPERIVIAETGRLIDELQKRGIALAGVVANYMTPENDCLCDRMLRQFEQAAIATLEHPVVTVSRRDAPVTKLSELEELVRFS